MSDAEEEALLRAISLDVDSPEPRLVYADWLLQRGDPRGELVIAQHRYATAPTSALRARISELESTLYPQVRSPLDSGDVIGAWWLGFVDQLTMHRRVLALPNVAAWLDRVPLRFVRRLHLAITNPKAWTVVERWSHRAHVRAFRYGTTQKQLAELTPIARLLPTVEKLHLASARVPDLGALAALPIRELRLDLAELDATALSSLYARAWRLERLALRVDHTTRHGLTERVAMLGALLDGAELASVRHLEVAGVWAAGIVEALVASGRIRSIESLSLDYTGLHDTRTRIAALAPQLAGVRLGFPDTGNYSDRYAAHELALLAEAMHQPDAIELFERVPSMDLDDAGFCGLARAALREDDAAVAACIDRLHRSVAYAPFTDAKLAKFARTVLELIAPDDRRWVAMKLVVARALLLDRQVGAAVELVEPLPAGEGVWLVRVLARRMLDDSAVLRPPDRAGSVWIEHAVTSDAPKLASSPRLVYRALAALIADRFDARVPTTAIAPQAIVHALAGVPPSVTATVSLDEQLDCAEIAVYAAYLDGDLRLAAARGLALAQALDGTSSARPWNHDLRMVLGALAPRSPRAPSGFADHLVRTTRVPEPREDLERLVARYFPLVE